MKKFIISTLCVAVFFIGLGGLIQETGARFKSDERALNLIKQAQTAIGGETAVRQISSMTIAGSVTKTFDFDGAAKTEQGDLEINLQMPNKFSKMLKLGREDNSTDAKSGEIKKRVNVVVMNNGGENSTFKRVEPNGENQGVFVIKKSDGDKVVLNGEGENTEVRKIIVDKELKVAGGGFNLHQNEMLRTTLALLLTAPQGMDVTFSYVGDGDVDGNACDVVEAKNSNQSVKLYLDKSSHLVRMMSYQGFKPMIFQINKDEMKNESNGETKVFTRRMEKPEMAEIQVKFSDFRNVNGVLLPYRWTQTVGGKADETLDVTNYEINPANIADKFQNMPPKVFVRTEQK